MEDRIPQSWIGKDVMLARNGAAESELIALKEVSELGVAYLYKEGEAGGEPVFIPWSSVSWMRPRIPDDLKDDQEEEE